MIGIIIILKISPIFNLCYNLFLLEYYIYMYIRERKQKKKVKINYNKQKK